MSASFSFTDLFISGECLYNVEGSTPSEIYSFVCSHASLPDGLDPDTLCKELNEREKILSTAVGNGISIPHPRRPLLKNEKDCRIITCFLRNPVDMMAPDYQHVKVMFILLSSSAVVHNQALGSLAKLLRNPDFRKVLSTSPKKEDLVYYSGKYLRTED